MFFEKRVELSAYAAQKAAIALVLLANQLKDRDPNAGLVLLTVAGALRPGRTVKIGKPLPMKPGQLTEGLEHLLPASGEVPPV